MKKSSASADNNNDVNVDHKKSSDKIEDLYKQYDSIGSMDITNNNLNDNDIDKSFDKILCDLPEAPKHTVSQSSDDITNVNDTNDVNDIKNNDKQKQPDKKTMEEIRQALNHKNSFNNTHISNLEKMQQDLNIVSSDSNAKSQPKSRNIKLIIVVLGVIFGLLGYMFVVDHPSVDKAATQENVTTFYNYFGIAQDWQRFYEAPAVDLMLENCNMGDDLNIFEFGFGTGFLATELLNKYHNLNYHGVDVSETMLAIATERIEEYIDKKNAQLTVAKDTLEILKSSENNSIDRFISTYVFDLLPQQIITDIVSELKHKLKKDGKICVTSLTNKINDNDRFVKMLLNGWNTISRVCPICMGGCRPIDVSKFIKNPFQITFEKVVTDWGIPSQIVVAERK